MPEQKRIVDSSTTDFKYVTCIAGYSSNPSSVGLEKCNRCGELGTTLGLTGVKLDASRCSKTYFTLLPLPGIWDPRSKWLWQYYKLKKQDGISEILF